MTTREIRKRGEKLGLKLDSSNKIDMIRAIQKAEGNQECFRSGRTSCGELACCWMEDCIPQQFAEMHSQGSLGARTGGWRR